MEGKRLIQRLTLRNFLSYGSEGASIDLLPLNVLIGPNASGKSNLIEALAVLRATTENLPTVFREGGGIAEYLWKGASSKPTAAIKALVEARDSSFEDDVLLYGIEFAQSRHRLEVTRESIKLHNEASSLHFEDEPGILYRQSEGEAIIVTHRLDEDGISVGTFSLELRPQDISPDQSILSQRRDPNFYPELTNLAENFARIAIFQDWTFGRSARVRAPQAADLPTDFLLPDARNLVLVLHELQQQTDTEGKLIEYLRRFYQPATRIRTKIQGGSVELLIDEGMGEQVSAARLSDGTLRYLSLLAILLHPSPPPLICIEEPELGLHPDIMPIIAGLLRDASTRTQLVITTHSETLVSALSDSPEAIIVCEPDPEGTQLRRLEPDALAKWLERYSLGEMWRMGEIGGTRW